MPNTSTKSEEAADIVFKVISEFPLYPLGDAVLHDKLPLEKAIEKASLLGRQKKVELSDCAFLSSFVAATFRLANPKFARILSELTIACAANLDTRHEDWAEIQCDHGWVLIASGDYAPSLHHFDKALEIYEKLNLQLKIAECQSGKATAFFRLGHFKEAARLLVVLTDIYNKHKSYGELAHVLQDFGTVCNALGRFESALKLYKNAKELYALQKDKSLASLSALNDMNIASLYNRMGRLRKALPLLQSAQKTLRKTDEVIKDELLAQCLVAEGEIYAALSKKDKAIHSCQLAIKIFDDVALKDHSYRYKLYRTIGVLYLKLGEYKEAGRLFQEVYDTAQSQDLKWRTLYGLGLVAARQGDMRARTFCEDAIGIIEQMRAGLFAEDFKDAFLQSVSQVYHEMIGLCMQQKLYARALEYVERLKSRNLAELMSRREMVPKNTPAKNVEHYRKIRLEIQATERSLALGQTRTAPEKTHKELEALAKKLDAMVSSFTKHDPLFDPYQTTHISAGEISRLIHDSSTAIIELFPTADATIAFIIKQGADIDQNTIYIPAYSLSSLKDEVEKLASLYQVMKESPAGAREIKVLKWQAAMISTLRNMHANLFEKIRPHLHGIRKIIFIPFGYYHLLPLHAMFSEKNGARRYVIDDYVVSYAPGAKILKHCMERQRPVAERLILLHANPQDTGALPCSDDELEVISSLYPGSRIIRDATEQDLIAHGKKAHILHLSGHADHDAFMFHDPYDMQKTKRFYREDILSSVDLSGVSLATLSACETGLPAAVQPTDEHISLASAFLYAGANSVVSSLWAVSDISTSLLMKKMYERIKAGSSPDEALREAQLWVISLGACKTQDIMPFDSKSISATRFVRNEFSASDEIDFSQPYHWAGFFCSGV